jgi:hypothetical protein
LKKQSGQSLEKIKDDIEKNSKEIKRKKKK